MIWKFKIICEFGMYLEDDWIREVEINSKITLNDLHLSILKIIGFDNDHLYDFFCGRHSRNRKIVFSENESYEIRQDVFCSILLEEIYPLPPNLRLYYIFDFGDRWTFRIVKTRKKAKEIDEKIEYPKVIKAIGQNPCQYPRQQN